MPQPRPTVERPAGITVLAGLFLAEAAYLLGTGLLNVRGHMSLASAHYVLEGLEIYGPAMFFLAAAALALLGVGLYVRVRWARRAAFCLLVANIALGIPALSSAVADMRISALLIEGAKVIFSAAYLWYMIQPDTRAAFGAD